MFDFLFYLIEKINKKNAKVRVIRSPPSISESNTPHANMSFCLLSSSTLKMFEDFIERTMWLEITHKMLDEKFRHDLPNQVFTDVLMSLVFSLLFL